MLSHQRTKALVLCQEFAKAVHKKLSAAVHGEPEDQLRAPLEQLLTALAQSLGADITLKGESHVASIGRPDFAVSVAQALTGYIEAKAPGTGADPRRFTGRNRDQWDRFKKLPNILYTDGNEWALFRDGEPVGRIVRLSGDIVADGEEAVIEEDAAEIEKIVSDLIAWVPIPPRNIQELTARLAPLCRLLREQVGEALHRPQSPVSSLKKDWQKYLFPQASDDRFADAYAQAVTFALLLARADGWDGKSIDTAATVLRSHHGTLSTALRVLAEPSATEGIETPIDVLVRVIGVVDANQLRSDEELQPRLIPEAGLSARDPWTYFYEDFLAAYDRDMRKNAGVYYTPVEVVRCQVRLVDELLRTKLKKPMGFADPGVITLDPAMGTGTYLLGIVDQALDAAASKKGPGAVPGIASALASQLVGFEFLVGPFSVAELRISQAIQRFGGRVPQDGLQVYLTDTLESPNNQPADLPYGTRELSKQHEKALKVKKNTPIIVCIGNPPYDRHEAIEDHAATGGWVRWGDQGNPRDAILEDFAKPARDAGHGGDLKNLYNLYIYFWRWALWKTFECVTPSGGGPDFPGIVSFISASSFLTGDAFVGLRQMLRQLCDEVWVIDLGGEGRGTRKEENVFAIQTPVCITIGYRAGKARPQAPAKVYYTRIRGTRIEKLAALDRIRKLADVGRTTCGDGWHAPMVARFMAEFSRWPNLTDLLPWQYSGVQGKRLWPIGPSPDTLDRRWRCLLAHSDRSEAFRETDDRRLSNTYGPALTSDSALDKPIAELPPSTKCPPIRRYGFRSFDRQVVIAEAALLSRPRPALWHVAGEHQIFFATSLSNPLGGGPALTCSADVPDLHYFCNRGAKDCLPLFRDTSGAYPNCLPGLLTLLNQRLGAKLTFDDLAAYVYGVLAHPGYTERFWDDLEHCELRVPLTKDIALFRESARLGRHLIWLHTYGERFVPANRSSGELPAGKARCTRAVPDSKGSYPDQFMYDAITQTIRVGVGDLFTASVFGGFAPVAPEVWAFEVSGLKVVRSWLGYRMRNRKGRKSSSPLDDLGPERWTPEFTDEFLKLLWILEATLESYPKQAVLLDRILAGPLFLASELPPVPPAMREPPRARVGEEPHLDLAFDSEEG